MELNFSNAIELIASFIAVFFAIYLIVSKHDKNVSNTFMAIFLLLMGLNLGQEYVELVIDPISTNLYVFITLTFFMLPASLFLYTKHSIRPNTKLNKQTLLHLITLLILNVVLVPSVYLENLKDNPAETNFHKMLNIAFYILFYLLLFAYQIASFKILNRNKTIYFENYSNTDIRRFQYLKNLNIIFTVTFIASAIKNLMVYNYTGPELEIAIGLVRLSLLFLFCWIILKRLDSPELFSQASHENKRIKEIVKGNSGKKFQRHELNDETNELIERVNKIMVEKEPFLSSTLTIDELAQQTNISTKDLSILINHTLNKHFFDFVNEYRIKKAMDLLRNPKDEKVTVLEILYEVGFNSKSSFNTAFKKHTGLTPTEYKKRASLKAA